MSQIQVQVTQDGKVVGTVGWVVDGGSNNAVQASPQGIDTLQEYYLQRLLLQDGAFFDANKVVQDLRDNYVWWEAIYPEFGDSLTDSVVAQMSGDIKGSNLTAQTLYIVFKKGTGANKALMGMINNNWDEDYVYFLDKRHPARVALGATDYAIICVEWYG